MAPVDKDIERWIVRKLDGEISDEDALALDRELIRNPGARRLMESYERIDKAAAEALSESMGESRPTVGDIDPSVHQLPPATWRSSSWLRKLAVGSVAAALLALLVARTSVLPVGRRATVSDSTLLNVPSGPARPLGLERESPDPLLRNVGLQTRPRIWRDTGREVFGVVGDDGNIYWIGVDRTRTAKITGNETL